MKLSNNVIGNSLLRLKKLPNVCNFSIYNFSIYNNQIFIHVKNKINNKMSVLKNYLSTKKWHVNICLYKRVLHYSQVLTTQNLLDKGFEDIKKVNDLTRFYSNKKWKKNVTSRNAEDMNNNKKLQKLSSVVKMESQLNCSRKKGTLSIAVVGGGCTLSTLIFLKQNPAIKEIRLIDTDDSLKLCACDLKQIDTTPKIRHYKRNFILDGLCGIDIVALMDEKNSVVANKGPFSQFKFSSNFVKHIAECMANACPNALIIVFTHPVTAIVPLISEIFKKSNIYNPNKIIGSAALYSMRTNAITANFLDLNPSCIKVPITGGIDSLTFVPLLSRTIPFDNFTLEDQCALIQQLKSANNCRFENESHGSSLSAGLAAAKFISTLVCGVQNQNNACVANAFIRSNIYPSCQYMASKIQFGPEGIRQIFDLPKISPKEVLLIEQSVPIINRIVDSVKYFVQTGNVK